jgi:hypothetical protein
MCPATRAGGTGPLTSAAPCPTPELAIGRCASPGCRRATFVAWSAMDAVAVSIAGAVATAWFAARSETTSVSARARLSCAISGVGTTAAPLVTIAADRWSAGRAATDGRAVGQGCRRCVASRPTQEPARPWVAILAPPGNCAASLGTGAVAHWTAGVASTVSRAAAQEHPMSAAPKRIPGYARPTSAIRSALRTAATSGMAAALRSTAGRARRDKSAASARAACAALRARFASWSPPARMLARRRSAARS